MFVAEFVGWAVGVGFAFDATTITLCVTSETGLTCTQCIVIARCAFGISAAQNTAFARISAFGAAVRIGDAILIWQTVFVRTASDLFRANVVHAELEIGAAGVAVARWLAHALQTQLIADAVTIRCANGATDARIANRSRRTLVVDAAVLDWHTSEQRVAGCARLTRTDADVIFDGAICALTARVRN